MENPGIAQSNETERDGKGGEKTNDGMFWYALFRNSNNYEKYL